MRLPPRILVVSEPQSPVTLNRPIRSLVVWLRLYFLLCFPLMYMSLLVLFSFSDSTHFFSKSYSSRTFPWSQWSLQKWTQLYHPSLSVYVSSSHMLSVPISSLRFVPPLFEAQSIKEASRSLGFQQQKLKLLKLTMQSTFSRTSILLLLVGEKLKRKNLKIILCVFQFLSVLPLQWSKSQSSRSRATSRSFSPRSSRSKKPQRPTDWSTLSVVRCPEESMLRSHSWPSTKLSSRTSLPTSSTTEPATSCSVSTDVLVFPM